MYSMYIHGGGSHAMKGQGGEVWTNETWVFCGRWRVVLLSWHWSGGCCTTEAPEQRSVCVHVRTHTYTHTLTVDSASTGHIWFPGLNSNKHFGPGSPRAFVCVCVCISVWACRAWSKMSGDDCGGIVCICVGVCEVRKAVFLTGACPLASHQHE